jgi:3-oxoacyl-[acyl-carrier protein] reductase
MFDLKGRTALVTGSTRGLGRAMAEALAKAGARVALNGLDEKRGKAVAAAIPGSTFHKADVTSEKDVARLVAETGDVDILVLNATCDQPHKPLEEYDWAFFQSMLDFFIKSPFLLTRAVLPAMKRKKRGRIINIGTEAFTRGVGNFTAYVAAKGGQNGFHRSLATELAPQGITVNMVSPGWIPVERHANDPQAEKDGYRALIPSDRWGVPEDVGGAIVFLASDAASFITGQNLHVNGGMTVA